MNLNWKICYIKGIFDHQKTFSIRWNNPIKLFHWLHQVWSFWFNLSIFNFNFYFQTLISWIFWTFLLNLSNFFFLNVLPFFLTGILEIKFSWPSNQFVFVKNAYYWGGSTSRRVFFYECVCVCVYVWDMCVPHMHMPWW